MIASRSPGPPFDLPMRDLRWRASLPPYRPHRAVWRCLSRHALVGRALLAAVVATCVLSTCTLA